MLIAKNKSIKVLINIKMEIWWDKRFDFELFKKYLIFTIFESFIYKF